MWNHSGSIPPPPIPSASHHMPYYQQHQQYQPHHMSSHYAPPPPPPVAATSHQQHDTHHHLHPPAYNAYPYPPQQTAKHERDTFETHTAATGGSATSEPAWQRRRVESSHSHTHNAYSSVHHLNGGHQAALPPPPLPRADQPYALPAAPAPFTMLTVRPEQYDEFLSARVLADLQQGTFVLSQRIPSPPPALSTNSTITIDLDLWNTYWGEFSEHFSTHEDAVQAALHLQNATSGTEVGAGSGKLNRRGVVVKIPAQLSLESFVSPTALQQHILNLMTRFGVVEFCRVQNDEIRVQFTMSTAAIEFASFARSIDASVMFPSNILQHHSNQRVAFATGRVHVFLVDQRTPISVPPASSNAPPQTRTHNPCTKLILGKRLDIPSMFLNALFRDLFEADHIEYQNGGSFVVAFSSHHLCKSALHILQQSFRQVFGLTLGYYEQKDVPPLDFTG